MIIFYKRAVLLNVILRENKQIYGSNITTKLNHINYLSKYKIIFIIIRLVLYYL